MIDETMDARFERDLRILLREHDPADAPASLYGSVASIPLRAQGRRGWAPRRMAFAGLALAAVVVVAVAGIAVALRPWGDLPIIGGPTAPPPTLVPGQGGELVLTYQVEPLDGVQPGPKDIEAVAVVLRSRIDATVGAAGVITTSSNGEITVSAAVDVTDENALTGLRQVLGTTGRLDFVPLGDEPASDGQALDLAAHPPLFSGDQVASARIGSDQTGQRTVDFTLGPEGTRLFASHTQANIGKYLAIVLDGVVISAPVIQSAIPNGEVQISQGGIGGFALADAQALITIVQSGALLFPIREISVGPLNPGASASTGPRGTESAAPSLSPAAVDPGTRYPDALIDGTSLGTADAPVTMEVYGDFQCPICTTHSLDIEPTLVAKYVQAGDLRITHHDIDLLGRGGDESKTTAIGGYCAVQQGKYWDYAHWIYENQDGEAQGGFRRDRVVAIATAAGLDAPAFTTCLDSAPAAAEVVATTTRATDALEINAVPTIYLDGTEYVGLKSASDWSALIDAELARVNAASASPTPSGITAP